MGSEFPILSETADGGAGTQEGATDGGRGAEDLTDVTCRTRCLPPRTEPAGTSQSQSAVTYGM